MISRVQKKDIVTCVLLSIITCGIYTVFWFIRITDDCSKASGDDSMDGVTSFLLSLITCGFYTWYWNYQIRNLPATDNSAVYLILSLLKFDFISYILIQSELNRLADFDYSK